MNEKKNPQMMNEEALEKVSGGTLAETETETETEEVIIAEYSVGQSILFHYIHGDMKGQHVGYKWVGKIIGLLNEPEGLYYRVEVGADAMAVVGDQYMTVYFGDILGLA